MRSARASTSAPEQPRRGEISRRSCDDSVLELRVAVVLTCYNEGAYIGDAVRSVLQQTRADLIESIVIADDGSDPATVETLREIESGDARIRVLYGGGGAGLPAQRNLAISHTSAPVLAILDGDDLWTPEKLERQMPALAADEGVGLVYSGYFTFGSDDLETAHEARVLDISAETDLCRAYFLNDPPIIPSTALIRRTAFEACGGFDPTVRVFEDTDFYIRLSRTTRFAFVREPLLYKRSRGSSITRARKDLMAHHALVALRAAAEDSRLLPLVPRRLSERARKLGNQQFLFGDSIGATHLLRLAVRFDLFNLRAWASLIAACWFSRPVYWVIGSRLRSRRVALGAVER
jgi:glycosyltransferase involved in cell wall biosynthesis